MASNPIYFFFAFLFFISEFISFAATPPSSLLLFHTGQYFLKKKTLLHLSASHINISSSNSDAGSLKMEKEVEHDEKEEEVPNR